jgi:hydroxymethylpyrimidine/phosphomethylpyrimidine kinase
MFRPVVLTIAGSDPSGGAGLQADLKTFAAHGVYGASVVTALTAQDTRGVRALLEVDPAFVAAQLDAVRDDLDVAAGKTGMLLRPDVIETVAARLRARPLPHLVVDPVMIATSGDPLIEPVAAARLRDLLLPLATLVTPNLHEAAALTGRPVASQAQMRDAARALLDLGARAALVKGGHLEGAPIDVLHDGRALHELPGARVPGGPTHGTGCTLSAAIAARLARGEELVAAATAAKRWVARAIAGALPIGHGARPLEHLTPVDVSASR